MPGWDGTEMGARQGPARAQVACSLVGGGRRPSADRLRGHAAGVWGRRQQPTTTREAAVPWVCVPGMTSAEGVIRSQAHSLLAGRLSGGGDSSSDLVCGPVSAPYAAAAECNSNLTFIKLYRGHALHRLCNSSRALARASSHASSVPPGTIGLSAHRRTCPPFLPRSTHRKLPPFRNEVSSSCSTAEVATASPSHPPPRSPPPVVFPGCLERR